MTNAASVPMGASDRDLPPEQVVFGIAHMKELREKVNQFAQTEAPVLIRGEIGTGKKTIAQLIHYKSSRGAGPFVKVTCSTVSGTDSGTELFGPEGADSRPEIMLRAAHGTLFLDEIGDLSKAFQAKLRQWFSAGQDNSMKRRAGASDVRLICATRHNLEQAVERGAFRSDLYLRIRPCCIEMPPLRERKADIPMLVDYFLERYKRRFNRSVKPLSTSTLRKLEDRSWPGNIGELENLIKRYVVLGSESAICDSLAEAVALSLSEVESASGSLSLKRITRQASRELERHIILLVLAENRGNRRQTAKVLNISYRALLYKLKEAMAAGVAVPANSSRQIAPVQARDLSS
jgi:two-component system response regulator AtoC